MSEKQMNKSRRNAMKVMLGGLATVPLMNLVGIAAAQAEDLPHVDPATDPTAQALKYACRRNPGRSRRRCSSGQAAGRAALRQLPVRAGRCR